ncbi:MAG: TOMM precursor leader peptide-binding protein [Pseudonocardiaceae bacterium]
MAPLRTAPEPMVTVRGAGLLATAIAEAVADRAGPGRAAGHPVVVSASDAWGLPDRVPDAVWLPVRAELGRVVIGPAEIPATPGCAECLRLRTSRARQTQGKIDAVLAAHRERLFTRPSTWLTGLAAGLVAALVAAEVDRLAAGRTAWTSAATVCVDLDTLAVHRHRFLPEPLCPVCGDLPEDREELAELVLAARPKPGPDVHRVRSLAGELDALLDIYVDAETGLIRQLKRGTQGGLVVAGALMPIRIPQAGGTRAGGTQWAVEPGVGRSRSYRTSELTGVLEALERYGGVEPGGKRTVVRGCFAGLSDRALDPRTLGVHPAQSYRTDGFGFREFGPDEVCRWVWGYSFGRKEPVLVPETLAYYYIRHRDPDDRPFVYEISNGCALGSCVEEAILYGLLEAVERDAFLMTWYGRMPLSRIDLAGAPDRAIPLQAAAITAETGYQVLVFDSTAEHGIPSVWAMAVRPGGAGATPRPKTVCAAGAQPTLERAIMSALSELGPLLADFVGRFPGEQARAEQMVRDPSLVTTMHDHSTLYGADAAFDRLGFLVNSPARRELDGRAEFRGADLRDDLTELLARIEAAGMDVVVVDQTTPEHRAGGFCCVKVLMPGAVPMTFGYRNRRIHGLPRLLSVPHRLGYAQRPLSAADLNPHPHPFP